MDGVGQGGFFRFSFILSIKFPPTKFDETLSDLGNYRCRLHQTSSDILINPFLASRINFTYPKRWNLLHNSLAISHTRPKSISLSLNTRIHTLSSSRLYINASVIFF
jgi:hypothetical protein